MCATQRKDGMDYLFLLEITEFDDILDLELEELGVEA